MALSHKYTLLCDEVRQENTGKFIILGLYTPDIVVPAVPLVLQAMTFFNLLETDAAGKFDFAITLTSKTEQLAMAGGQAAANQPGMIALPFRFGPVQLKVDGDYLFTLESPSLPAKVEHRFRVVVPPKAAGGVFH